MSHTPRGRTTRCNAPITGRLPDFLIIGAAKAGTRSLYHALRAHPDVFMPKGAFETTNTPGGKRLTVGLQEPAFFSSENDAFWKLGIDWYRSLFTQAAAHQRCGEASTTYTRLPHFENAAERIHAVVPGVKLIYIVRHPVDRAYSHYIWRHTVEVRPGSPIRTCFETYVLSDPMCLDTSRYALQLQAYLQLFAKDQILLIVAEEFARYPIEAVERVCRFLGVRSCAEVGIESMARKNRTADLLQQLAADHAVNGLARVPGIRWAAHVLPRRMRSWVRTMTIRAGKKTARWSFRPAPMMEETRDKLLREFEPDIAMVESLLGRELPGWRE